MAFPIVTPRDHDFTNSNLHHIRKLLSIWTLLEKWFLRRFLNDPTHFFLVCFDYLPFDDDVALYFNNLESPLPKDDFYQIREWAYTDLWIYQRWDQVPWRSKHPLSIDHTRRKPPFLIRKTVLTVVKISVNNGITIVMKHIRQHVAQRKVYGQIRSLWRP
jgi:hypothetical protein